MKLKKNLMIGILFKLFFLSCMTYSVVEIIATGLDLDYDNASVILTIIVINIIFIVLGLFKKRRKVWLPVVLALLLLLLLYMGVIYLRGVVLGFQSVADNMIYQFKSFYNIDLVSFGVEPTIYSLTAFFSFVTFILICSYYLSLHWIKESWLAFLPGGLVILVELLLGTKPSTWSLFLYMIGGIGICTAFQRDVTIELRNHMMMLMSVLMTVTLFISAVIVYPAFQPSEDTLTSVKHDLVNFYKDRNVYFYAGGNNQNADSVKAVGGISKGNLENAGSISFSNTKHLEVTVNEKPDNMIYLKGYVASVYSDNNWMELDSTEFYQIMESYGYTPEEAGIKAQQVSLNVLADIFIQESMEIKYFGKDNVIYPYTADLGLDYTFGGDSNVIKNEWSGDTFRYYPEFYSLLNGNIDDWNYINYQTENLMQDVFFDQSDFLILYTNYISNQPEYYTYYPGAAKWSEIDQYFSTDISKWESVDVIIEAVRSYLKETAVYDLNPGKVPEGEEFVDYFLFENKKGFCMHFASAATLMFRYYGLPSRYVEGYVVAPGDFIENEDGTYTAVVKDNRAHAWTEIYNSDYGWIPVEVTPSYTEGQIPTDNQDTDSSDSTLTHKSDREIKTTMATEEGNIQDNTSKNDIKEEEEQGAINAPKTGYNWGLYIVLIILVMIAVLLIIAVRRYIIVYSRYKKMYGKDYREGVLICYSEILKLLSICGFTYDEAESEEINANMVERSFDFFEKGEYKLFTELVLKAVYSQHELTKDERNQSTHLYKKLRLKTYEQLRVTRKIWFMWAACL